MKKQHVNQLDLDSCRIILVNRHKLECARLQKLLLASKMLCKSVSDLEQAVVEIKTAERQNIPFQICLLDDVALKQFGTDKYIRLMHSEASLRKISHMLVCSQTAKVNKPAIKKADFAAYFSRPLSIDKFLTSVRTIATLSGQTPMLQANDPTESQTGTVLLVDDSKVNQKLTARMLQKLGLAVVIANNGQECVEEVQSRTFNLVFMDCQMPVLNGYEATQQIRKLSPNDQHLPIIALTAENLDVDIERCKNAGMDDFLTKPVSKASLEQMLSKWMT